MGANGLSNGRGALLGTLSFLMALIAVWCVAMIGFTSFTAFDPPGWLRITSMASFPVAIIASFGSGLAGLVRGSGRLWAVLGLVLASLSFVAFRLMINYGG